MSGKIPNAEALSKVFGNYGFKYLGGDMSSVFMTAVTINNIPITIKGTAVGGSVNVEICTPVLPLEPLLKESVQFILNKNA